MRLRTFTASDMPSAMQLVRDALGDDAIILSTESGGNKSQVSVTAAIEEQDESEFVKAAIPQAPKPKPASLYTPPPAASPATADIRYELQNIFRFHNVPEVFISKLMQKMPEADLQTIAASRHTQEEHVRLALEALLSRFFTFEPLRLTTQAMRLMLVGPPGIGKTLTVAKLATKLAMDKHPLTVITTDTTRAGGIEQLQAFTSILGLELKVAHGRGELYDILQSLPPHMRVLIDTAGCTPYNSEEFRDLESIATIKGVEPILVLPAGGDSLESIDMVEIFRQLPIRRLLVTRADTARRFGGILAAAAAHGLAFSNCSRTASIMDTLQPLETPLLAQLLLKYKIK